MKKVLVVSYSQTGQTEELVSNLLKPLQNNVGIEITWEKISPLNAIEFPWSGYRFFDAFPETVKEEPLPLYPFHFNPAENYDLIILGYQPWFLSVSRPMLSFMKSAEAAQVMKNKPVITILGCRNMWVTAHEKMKRLIAHNGGKLKGHIALVDKSGNVTSMVSILAWMLKGQREGFMGIFPRSGVSVKDTLETERFGKPIKEALFNNDYHVLQSTLLNLGAVEIKHSLLLMEGRGAKNFQFFAKWISAKGREGDKARSGRLRLFMILLPTAVVILTPITAILKLIVLNLKRKQLTAEAEYIKGIDLNVS